MTQVVLVEFDLWDGASIQTLRLSNVGPVTIAATFPPVPDTTLGVEGRASVDYLLDNDFTPLLDNDGTELTL